MTFETTECLCVCLCVCLCKRGAVLLQYTWRVRTALQQASVRLAILRDCTTRRSDPVPSALTVLHSLSHVMERVDECAHIHTHYMDGSLGLGH
ncbi:uncharacterized protein SETTUDRAFT_166604 [Exserohilum turcica Et28A]|uniref:Uncharacterized protein n=1 Tax=Exserohilum turcicum (strain 28A) TaxID=671987 RepID=R0KNM7_EXST2|nr:uncharacterized protein SETTUDRAFT_166604 [Exserohilum turcica Et28A]EOA90644.1 hypothetical protein SETTUDRAFT_166604 [Exserohilum turcica Et28A]